MSDIKGLVFI